MEVGEMPDREELMYLVAQGLSTSREAAERQEAVDQGRGIPVWGAVIHHRRAAEMLESVAETLRALSEAHKAQL